MRLTTRLFAALRRVASRNPEHDPVLRGAYLRPRGPLGTSAIATDGSILLDVLHHDAELPGGEGWVIPPNAVEAAARMDGPVYLSAGPGAAALTSGPKSVEWDAAGERPYPDTDKAIRLVFQEEEPRRGRITFDLHVLGRAIDALRRIHPETDKHRETGERIRCHLYLLAAEKAVGVRIEDRYAPGLETKAIVMPLLLRDGEAPIGDQARPLAQARRPAAKPRPEGSHDD